MADVKIIPRVRCDNCSVTAEKDLSGKDYRTPRTWGSVSVDPTDLGSNYPNTIRMKDLCAACLKAVHVAVGEALCARRKEEGIET